MKASLIKLFTPLLQQFDNNEEPANYKESHRTALKVMGVLFWFLSCGAIVTGYYAGSMISAFVPVLAFFCVGLVALVIGGLGSNGAVAKIWGTN
ncbi:hypothetical protein [Paraglaciecola sp. L3A3]|uniref:hypothetical protein n=1 Tax=Paraglaciecola sp. L3A3 TaxID=2686358 RepID=UPI00131E41CC|nr:hypothetical protein [Paraglaciecola sp. L3A3]